MTAPQSRKQPPMSTKPLPTEELAGLIERATKGPWAIEGDIHGPDGHGHIISAGVNSYGDGPNSYVCRALRCTRDDARLIALSPDLAAEVISLRKRVEELDSDLWASAMASCVGLSSGPNGDGNMRVSVIFPVGHEFPLFDLLSELFNPEARQALLKTDAQS